MRTITVCWRWPAALACVTLGGCATSTTLTPQLPDKQIPSCRLHAAVQYDGKPEYLPAALGGERGPPGPVVFRYSFEAQYGLNPVNAFVAFVNPLELFGFPVSSDNMVVTGRVDVVGGDAVIRSYGAAAAMKRSSTVFSEGESFTDMRHRGLMLVRDNLSGQLCHDEALLVAMLKSDANP